VIVLLRSFNQARTSLLSRLFCSRIKQRQAAENAASYCLHNRKIEHFRKNGSRTILGPLSTVRTILGCLSRPGRCVATRHPLQKRSEHVRGSIESVLRCHQSEPFARRSKRYVLYLRQVWGRDWLGGRCWLPVFIPLYDCSTTLEFKVFMLAVNKALDVFKPSKTLGICLVTYLPI